MTPSSSPNEVERVFGINVQVDYLTNFINLMDTTGTCWTFHDPLGILNQLTRKLPARPSNCFNFFAVMFRHTMTDCLGVKGTIVRMAFHGHCRKDLARMMQDRDPSNAGGLRI